MDRIGIMGGTFNPIHIGHLMLAEAAGEALSLDEVWFVPTGYSYMKGNRPSLEKMPLPGERLAMTELAVQDNARFRCLDIEVRREGATYTYETLEELRATYPDRKFFFVFGADCLYTIENWREPERIFDACEFVAAVRQGASTEAMQEKIAQLRERFDARITLLPFRNLEISSTEIRTCVKEGRSIRYMTPPPVIDYIGEKGFYREGKRGNEND